MKVLYPASNNRAKLSDDQISLKISRYIHCSLCTDCTGLHPSSSLELVRDDRETDNYLTDLAGYGSDDDDGPVDYLQLCDCGHEPRQHGANEAELDHDEFERRVRVALSLDEHLEATGKLLDFAYSDAQVTALKDEMRLPVAPASPLTEPVASPALSSSDKPLLSPTSSQFSDEDGPPLAKRRRISEDEEEEEEQPLALTARLNQSAMNRPENGRVPPGRRSGKKTSSKKSKAHTAPTSIAPPTGEVQAVMNGEISPMNGHERTVKMEEQMDEGQLDRLATGVTVDSSAATSAPPIKPEKPSAVELRRGLIQVLPVENDGQPRSLVILTNLKTLFRKQLPVMPREYIARLVFDSNSKCLAICKRGYKVVGGICFRPFPHRGFAEIVFFATASVAQEKGYGGMLMDHFKAHIRNIYPDMMYFLTYADNFAVGYFKKQGFSKEITLDRSVWAGYIKDYEGGTIMQCTLLRNVDYLATKDMLAQQREAILAKIRQMSKSHIVYDGLAQFQNGRGEGVILDPHDIPGLKESGWTPDMTEDRRPVTKNTERSIMSRLLSEMQTHPSAWPFQAPVNRAEVPDYYDVIDQPMDLSTMEKKLDDGQYTSLETFTDDAQLIFENCRFYNAEESIWWKHATKLEKHFKDTLARLRS